MPFSKLTPVDEVISFLTSSAACLVGKELVAIDQAMGRVLAQDVISTINVPAADNSAMDGYAINVAGLKPGDLLNVSDRIPAGSTGQSLVQGTIARIFTGAPVPDGADAVIIQENTEKNGTQVRLVKIPQQGENIRLAGQDISAGALILNQGRRLLAQDIGLIASVGYAEIEVYQKLKVALMSTGDELVEPPLALKPGQIYNSNHYTLQGLVRQLGMEVINIGLVADDLTSTIDALQRAACEADCIISTGGVSVGEEDYVKAAVESLGKLDLWRLAIKPGKPLAFGQVNQTPFFGLPGNPVSSFVTFMMIARPYLLKSQGASELALTTVFANSGFAVKGGSRREYFRVQVDYDADGNSCVTNFSNQGSGIMSSVSWANGLAEIEIDRSVEVGDRVKVYLLN